MGRRNKPDEEPAGAPEWLVTFSDCMTLLLTFFVLMLSFASFEKGAISTLGDSFANAMPSISLFSRDNKESLHAKQASQEPVDPTEGTETRTLAQEMKKNFMREKKPLDFRNLKVFYMPSEEFFWGRGRALSKAGIEVLDALAVFLQSTPGRVVVSENGPGPDSDLGLRRALAVVEYLSKQRQIPQSRFSISDRTTMRQAREGRGLEITLLERSVYE